MLLSLKKKKGDADTAIEPPKPDKRLETHASTIEQTAQFIPYYCHYNTHTLLTKNGELMQVFRIVNNLQGLEYENSYDTTSVVRDAIRQSLLQHVHTDKIAIWFHTMRKRKPIRYRGKFKEALATSVHERWQKLNHWKYQYYNEVYVSVLYDGQNSELLDTRHLKDVMMPRRNRYFRNAYLEVAYEQLDKTVNAMMASISKAFSVQRLSIVERVPPQTEVPVTQAIYYSELMEFIGTLVNLRVETFLLPELDISKAIPTTIQTFGFNALETKSPAGKRRFAAILTLKQYREVPLETIDLLLQAPMEFILTQAFHFIPHTGALTQYKEQKYLFDISGDSYCIKASGIEDMMSSQSNQSTDFGEHQTSIMVLADEFKQLDSEIIKVQSAFARLGLITIREDVKLEECFWSQIPGNFEFLRRKDTINTSRAGGFTRLNRFPQGLSTGTHWGDAVTILPTQVGSPYFFNFHYQDNGHTLIYDFNSFGDHVCHIMMNFLLTETRKFDNRIYIFDRGQSANLYMQKMGGQYYHFPRLSHSQEEEGKQINPFALPDTPRNRSFLVAWCGLVAAGNAGLNDVQKEKIKAALEELYAGPEDKRNLTGLVSYLAPVDPALAKTFSKWHSEGVYSGVLDGPNDEFDPMQPLHAFDMTAVLKHKECVLPVFTYLLHRIVTSIDGRPSIIVIYDAWDLLDNPFVAPRLESLMEMLQQNNAMVVFTTSKPFNVVSTQIFDIITKNCATTIILPDDITREYASKPELKINEYEAKRLLKMDRQKGEFLYKQDNETIELRAYLKELDDLYAVFSNDIKNLAAALGKFSNKPSGSSQDE